MRGPPRIRNSFRLGFVGLCGFDAPNNFSFLYPVNMQKPTAPTSETNKAHRLNPTQEISENRRRVPTGRAPSVIPRYPSSRAFAFLRPCVSPLRLRVIAPLRLIPERKNTIDSDTKLDSHANFYDHKAGLRESSPRLKAR